MTRWRLGVLGLLLGLAGAASAADSAATGQLRWAGDSEGGAPHLPGTPQIPPS